MAAKKTAAEHIQSLKDCCEDACPGSVAKIEALGIDWAKLLQNLPALFALFMAIFGGTQPPVTP